MYALQWTTNFYGAGSAGRINMFSFNHFSLSVDPTSTFFGGTTPIYILHTLVPNHNMLGQ